MTGGRLYLPKPFPEEGLPGFFLLRRKWPAPPCKLHQPVAQETQHYAGNNPARQELQAYHADAQPVKRSPGPLLHPPFSASASLPRRWESPRWKKGTTPATTGPEWQKGEAGRGKPRHQNGYGDIPLAPQAGKHAPQALHGQRGNRRRGPPAGARRYGLPVPRPVNRIKNTGGKELACPRFFAHLRQQVKPDFAHQLPVAVFHPPQSLL